MRLLTVAMLPLVFAACAPDKPGCLDSGKASCVPAEPCSALVYDACKDTSLDAFVLSAATERPAGLDAAAAAGDIVLKNGLITAVLDAPDHPNWLAVSGGHLMDLAPKGGADMLTQVSHVTGILPRDAIQYTDLRIGEKTADRVTVIARGYLYGDERIVVVTRYELHPCDPGVRIRTELYNGGRTPQAIYLADAHFWGNRNLTPFAPIAGEGFKHPLLDLVAIDDAFRDFPFMSANSHLEDSTDTSYATIACDRPALSGVNTTMLSAAGTARSVVMPGDGIAFERVIVTAAGRGSAPAQKIALDTRAKLFGEGYVTIKGSARFSVINSGGNGIPKGFERDLSLVFVEDSANAGADGKGIPWAQVVPAADGSYSVALPPNKSYKVHISSFGQEIVSPQTCAVGDYDDSCVFKDLPPPGRIQTIVRLLPTLTPSDAEVVLVPRAGSSDGAGSLDGLFSTCTPYLGSPHGASPACNRVLVPSGDTTFQVPPGKYWLYATHGPAYQLGRVSVDVEADKFQRVVIDLAPLDVYPKGSLSGDFHVHGGRSFDTTFPDYDRVLAMLATGLHVIAASDHDIVGNYADELARQNAGARLVVIPAVEMTGLVLFYHRAGSAVPRTLGHFNFWPMQWDPLMPRSGAPWDELKEPGALYDAMRPLIGTDGVAQLNHPYAESLLGRDEGYARAIGYDVRKKIGEANATPQGQWRQTPAGGADNLGHDTQEVMNGAEIMNFLQYRALWVSFLKQGIVRAGTANSDSHTLNVEQVGYPRNIVLGDFDFPNVDLPSFNRAVKKGNMIGTNGPVITVSLRESSGAERGPSTDAMVPAPGAVFKLSVKAAPWIPVDELRVIVNGDVAKTIPMSLMSVADPFGTKGVLRYEGEIALSELLSGGDGFVFFEAGVALPAWADLDDDDGVPDTFDWNGDGTIDAKDSAVADKSLPRPPEKDPRFHIDVISPGTFPTCFTNPFLIDFAGNGWEAPGL